MNAQAAQSAEPIEIRPRTDTEGHLETRDTEGPLVVRRVGVIEHRLDRSR